MMAENSKIEWTHHTWNPWRGCTKVAEGCKFCYADALSKRNPKTLGIWGDGGTRVVASEAMWREPVEWNAAAKEAGERHRVFCASLADVFEDWKGPMMAAGKNPVILGKSFRASQGQWDRLTMNDVRARLFKLIDSTPHLDWLLLTKRPENVQRMWPYAIAISGGHDGRKQCPSCRTNEGVHGGCCCGLLAAGKITYRPNVWLGTSIATQADADRNIPLLLQCRDLSPVLFVSAEPLLGPINFTDGPANPSESQMADWSDLDQLDWLICGGESGPNARPCDVDAVRSLARQCKESGVACFVKQLGAKPVFWNHIDMQDWPRGVYFDSPEDNEPDGPVVALLSDKKGGDWNEWPADLRVREFPAVEAIA